MPAPRGPITVWFPQNKFDHRKEKLVFGFAFMSGILTEEKETQAFISSEVTQNPAGADVNFHDVFQF